jgi:retinol dehydrogenase-12
MIFLLSMARSSSFTGGYSGCGFELVKMLFHAGGKIYIAGRSKQKAEAAMDKILNSAPAPGDDTSKKDKEKNLVFLQLDLADLTTIEDSANEFLAREDRLDIIWHNAAVMVPPPDSVTAQGFEMQLGVNALGPWLFQHFLTPLCLKTAAQDGVAKFATRVIFVTSNAHSGSPLLDGVNWEDLNMPASEKVGIAWNLQRYGQSKAMNVMHAHELARRYGSQGLIVVSVHPGSLTTNLQQHLPWWLNAVFASSRYHPRFGALSELYAGFNSEIDTTMLEDGGMNGGYVLPWDRFGEGATHVFEGLTQRNTGDRLWKLCEEMLKDYM